MVKKQQPAPDSRPGALTEGDHRGRPGAAEASYRVTAEAGVHVDKAGARGAAEPDGHGIAEAGNRMGGVGRTLAWWLAGAGVLSGVVLGLFLKLAEGATDIPVYRLLLSVEYIPGLRSWVTSELGEFLLHLVVSVGFMLVAGWAAYRFLHVRRQRQLFLVAASLLVGVSLYPSTVLSSGTPGLGDGAAWFWWLTGHALYGWVNAMLLPKQLEAADV